MTQDTLLFDRLNGQLDGLSRNQRLLARYIQSHYQGVAFSNIKELARLSGVSEATVVRFAKRLGFGGYPAFQKEIRRQVRADLKGTERFELTYRAQGAGQSVLSGVIRKEMENIAHLEKMHDHAAFRRALLAIRKASEVVIVGTRGTATLAQHLWFGLGKLEVKVRRVLAITTETYDEVSRLDGKACLCVIGFPRYLRELAQLLAFAKRRRLLTLVITDSPHSPLRGDMNLYAPAESASFVAFHCAPLIMINALLHELSLLDKARTLNALKRFETLAESESYFH